MKEWISGFPKLLYQLQTGSLDFTQVWFPKDPIKLSDDFGNFDEWSKQENISKCRFSFVSCKANNKKFIQASAQPIADVYKMIIQNTATIYLLSALLIVVT